MDFLSLFFSIRGLKEEIKLGENYNQLENFEKLENMLLDMFKNKF